MEGGKGKYDRGDGKSEGKGEEGSGNLKGNGGWGKRTTPEEVYLSPWLMGVSWGHTRCTLGQGDRAGEEEGEGEGEGRGGGRRGLHD